jgi:hypothetical protein
VFKFSLNGISLQWVLETPISVSTKLSPKILDFSVPPEVQRIISFLSFSFDNKLATHLVPFPQASEILPSELKNSKPASIFLFFFIKIS